MDIISIRTPSLGDATYLAVTGSLAVIVDPQRDIGRFREVLDDRKLTLTHVLETHVHNDYISGGRDLAQRTGADLVLPAGSGAAFSFVPAFHHEELTVGGALAIRPLHTPGHTPEHTSYLLVLDEEPLAVFTGGSLLVGAAGRTDLLGERYAHQLAVLQFGSLQRLAALPDDTGVYPTHGEGSFCTASGAGRTTSTIGQEKAENLLLQFEDADAFAAQQLAGLVPYPAYYTHMGPINKKGPRALEPPDLPGLAPEDVAAHIQAGGSVLDGRDRESFAVGHIPGSLGIELGDSFAPWAGWLLEFNTPLVLVLSDEQDATQAAVELGRIGFEQVVGVLRGVEEWAATGRPLEEYPTATAEQLASAVAADPSVQVLDVRDPMEWEEGHLDGSRHCYVPDLRSGIPEGIDASRPLWLVCRTGNRASIGAGLVERHGVTPTVVSSGGVPDLLHA